MSWRKVKSSWWWTRPELGSRHEHHSRIRPRVESSPDWKRMAAFPSGACHRDGAARMNAAGSSSTAFARTRFVIVSDRLPSRMELLPFHCSSWIPAWVENPPTRCFSPRLRGGEGFRGNDGKRRLERAYALDTPSAAAGQVLRVRQACAGMAGSSAMSPPRRHSRDYRNPLLESLAQQRSAPPVVVCSFRDSVRAKKPAP